MSTWDRGYPAPSSPDGEAWRKRCRLTGQPDPYGARYETPGAVIEDVAHILATVPGTAFYDDTGRALVLIGNDYVVSVSPPDGDFNNGNPTTSSAYLTTVIPDTDVAGWMTGWEC